MERSFASMAFLVSAIMFSITLGAWWTQRTVFAPDDSGDTAAAILEDPDIRNQLRQLITSVGARPLQTTSDDLGQFLDHYVLTTDAGADELAGVIGRVHRLAIGETNAKVVLTGQDLVSVVRNQRAIEIDDITIPANTIGIFDSTRKALNWIIIGTAVLGLAAMLLGVFLRPDRRDVLRGIGEGFVAIAISMLIFGYLLPVHFFPALDSRPWVGIAPRLALANIEVTVGAAILFGVSGGLMILRSATGSGGHKQWSTPLSATRYRDSDHSWS